MSALRGDAPPPAAARLPEGLASALRQVARDIERARGEIEAERPFNLDGLPRSVDAICQDIAALPPSQRPAGMVPLAALVKALDRLYSLIESRHAALSERLALLDHQTHQP